MISVTRINGKPYVINADLIEFIESTPDTVITTISGKKIMVADTIDQVIDKVLEYRRKVFPYKELVRDVEEEVREFIRSMRH